MKKIIFWFILLVTVVFITESFGHLLYQIIKRGWVWELQHNVFNIRSFTELVHDDRMIVNKRNFSCIVCDNFGAAGGGSLKREETRNFQVTTDSHGFRIGRNKYFKDKDNIVFLGDSVPFGWGIEGEKSIPSQFYDLLQKNFLLEYGVINASSPSYSLYQAIKHYEYEISGKFPIKYVILQIYDPASQFLIWGREWNKKMCWAVYDRLVSTQEIGRGKIGIQNPYRRLLIKYSSIYYLIYRLKTRLERAKGLDISDKEAFVFFEKEIFMMLEGFYNLLKKEKTILIILPVNPASSLSANTVSIDRLDLENKKMLVVIGYLNKTLHRFASAHKDVYLFDVSSYFDNIGRDGLFIDECCHLSETGSQKQAEFIFEQLKKNDLL